MSEATEGKGEGKGRLYPSKKDISGYEQSRSGFYRPIRAPVDLTPEQESADKLAADQRKLDQLYGLLANTTSEKARARILRDIKKLGGEVLT